MGHHSHRNPLTRKSSQCKICKSSICAEIDQALANGETRKNIIAWAEKAQPGINLNLGNVSSHKKSHIFPTKKNAMKIVNIKEGEDPEKKKNDQTLSDAQILSLSGFLDLVIAKVNTAIKSGAMKPTVAEGVKAAEIKAKIKESSKFEKELVKFFNEVSEKHGIGS